MTGPRPAVALVGPTASGKSALAQQWAEHHPNVELVAADSMQVYRGMDIGTAKPTPREREVVRHHLVDVVDPSEEFTVARYQQMATAAIAGIEGRANQAWLVGGTGLYVQAVVDSLEIPGQFPEVRASLDADADTDGLYRQLQQLDPTAAARIVPTNRRRIVRALEVTIGSGRPFSTYGPGVDAFPPTDVRLIGLRVPRHELDERIAARYRAQLEAGLLDEVRALLERPEPLSRTARQALGYKELIDHLEGRCSLDDALELAVNRTRQFARRQERWFRRDPRIGWIDAGSGHNALAALEEALED